MATPQNFRSAFNGFNREDVVHYLEYINTKHSNQLSQLTAENQELRAAVLQPAQDLQELVESLQAQCDELTAQLEEEKNADEIGDSNDEGGVLHCIYVNLQRVTVGEVEMLAHYERKGCECTRQQQQFNENPDCIFQVCYVMLGRA